MDGRLFIVLVPVMSISDDAPERAPMMPIAFVLDENCRGPLWSAIQSHNQKGPHPLDAVRVGDRPDLPLQSSDPAILAWAEQAGRILLTLDENTMPGYFVAHLRSGHHSPGVLILRENVPLREIVEGLILLAYATDPADWPDRLEYFP